MFENLKSINNLLCQRYSTIEKNIRSGYSSFYDSLGDLIDNYLKAIAVKERIRIGEDFSSGRILKDNLYVFLLNDVKISKTAYDELRATVRFINEHKHENEKGIQFDTAVKTLRSFFNVYFKIAQHYDPTYNEIFDEFYYKSIFKSNEIELSKLKAEILELKDELKKEKNLSEKQYNILLNLQDLHSLNNPDEETLHRLTEILLNLKDLKIDALHQKLDNALELLIEQKTALIESRIISLASLYSIVGRDTEFLRIHLPIAANDVQTDAFSKMIKDSLENVKK